MSNFLFAYHGGEMPETPEARADLMARWSTWMEGLGGALVTPGNPVGMSKTVSTTGVADNGGSNPLSGYSIVEAADVDAACAMAKGCPHLDHGTIEVAEIVEMTP
jgi:hypothetical protein